MDDKITINAMMENDMFAFLRNNGYWGALKDGYLQCPCGRTISEKNLTAMKGDKENNRMIFYHSVICMKE